MNAKCCGTTKLKLMKPMWHQTIECKLNYLKGYLGDFNFGDQIRALRLHDVNLVENGQLVAALFRDYSMLAAAYLLEPVCVAVSPSPTSTTWQKMVRPASGQLTACALPLYFFADICAQFLHTPYAVTFAAIGARKDAGFRHVWYRTRIITGQYSSAAFAPVTKAWRLPVARCSACTSCSVFR